MWWCLQFLWCIRGVQTLAFETGKAERVWECQVGLCSSLLIIAMLHNNPIFRCCLSSWIIQPCLVWLRVGSFSGSAFHLSVKLEEVGKSGGHRSGVCASSLKYKMMLFILCVWFFRDKVMLLAPLWMTQPWCHGLLCRFPYLFPMSPGYLRSP